MDCRGGALSGVDADVLIVPVFTEDASADAARLDVATHGESARAVASKEFQAKLYEIFVTPIVDSAWRARRVLLVGAGPVGACGGLILRRVATAAGLAARQKRAGRAAFVVPRGENAAERAQAVAEGLTLAEFNGGTYKTGDHDAAPSPVWTVLVEGQDEVPADVRAAVARGRILGDCCNLARDLVNEPGNTLTPTELAKRAAAVVADTGVAVDVLDETRIAELGMGLLLGVARGSGEPPRLLVFRYEPAGAPASPVLGLVGKGVTFDSGGISIKAAQGMERMKDDMAGGAAVACAMRAIALLGAPMRVLGIVPIAENMPGGRAIKPGDVLTSAEGKTVEVVNTDAEGRLLLGDGLWYARRLGATHLVDIATLTGACLVALGKAASGLFGTPDEWVDRVRRVANEAGDRVWPMPLFEEHREQLKSEIADLMNSGGRPAGASTAATFLKEFTGGLPWAHIDIAGTAWAEEARPFLPKGPSGVGVRTLASLAFERL